MAETFLSLVDIQKLEAEIQKMNVEIEELTRHQVEEAIKQAVLSGDFKKLIVQGSEHKQAVIYCPYLGVEELRDENQRLRDLLETNGIDPYASSSYNEQ